MPGGHQAFAEKLEVILKENPILADQIRRERGEDIVKPNGNGSSSSPRAAHTLPSSDRVTNRHSLQLYIGNIPSGIDGVALTTLLNERAKRQGIDGHGPNGPVLHCQVSSTFAFANFSSAASATAFIRGNQAIPCMGRMLKIGRPKLYSGPPDVCVDTSIPIDLDQLGLPDIKGVDTSKLLTQLEEGIVAQEEKLEQYGDPSPCFVLADIAAEDEEDVEDIELDVAEECQSFGSVVKAKWCNGTVLVRMATVEDARKAMDKLSGRTFAGAPVKPMFCSENDFETRQRGFVKK